MLPSDLYNNKLSKGDWERNPAQADLIKILEILRQFFQTNRLALTLRLGAHDSIQGALAFQFRIGGGSPPPDLLLGPDMGTQMEARSKCGLEGSKACRPAATHEVKVVDKGQSKQRTAVKTKNCTCFFRCR